MFEKLFKPHSDLAALVLRLGLAAIFIVHGYIKLDFSARLIAELSVPEQRIVGAIEFGAGVALLLGVASRLAALALIPIQAGAIHLVTGKRALEVVELNYNKIQLVVGPEYNLVLIGMCIGVILLGSGWYSMDHCVMTWWKRSKVTTAAHPAPPVGSAGVA